MEILRLRNTATTIYFPMIKAGAQDFAQGGDWGPVSGDCKYSEDGAAFANTTNLPTHEGSGIWSLPLVAGELDGKITVISIVDSAPKAVEDQAILICTYGSSGAQIEEFPADIKKWLTVAPNALVSGRVDSRPGALASNVITASSIAANAIASAGIATDAIGSAQLAAAAAQEIADAILNRDIDNVEDGCPVHSLGFAVLKAVSRIAESGGTLTIYKTDGSTAKGTQTLQTDPTNDPIDEVSAAVAS
ncbi:MAG: hypothetical protein JSV90_05010 [Methanobacteriota archaeon]|nr:MAG: hypothetical protein JSV90_05010 [Euryarchaeota archaeon]